MVLGNDRTIIYTDITIKIQKLDTFICLSSHAVTLITATILVLNSQGLPASQSKFNSFAIRKIRVARLEQSSRQTFEYLQGRHSIFQSHLQKHLCFRHVGRGKLSLSSGNIPDLELCVHLNLSHLAK